MIIGVFFSFYWYLIFKVFIITLWSENMAYKISIFRCDWSCLCSLVQIPVYLITSCRNVWSLCKMRLGRRAQALLGTEGRFKHSSPLAELPLKPPECCFLFCPFELTLPSNSALRFCIWLLSSLDFWTWVSNSTIYTLPIIFSWASHPKLSLFNKHTLLSNCDGASTVLDTANTQRTEQTIALPSWNLGGTGKLKTHENMLLLIC